ncbi:MAG: DUF523 domain-containing protein [Lachnospiraceae bacterium]|nr:DUF523 domain-containing protein [Lachnospiraceae bacterium]
MKILVSACLLGVCCRYNGEGELDPQVAALMKEHQLIPVCPEILGGLPTPRVPAERLGNQVITRENQDVTEAYTRGAAETLKLAKLYGCTRAILKERSPSCGSGRIYDGTFSRKQIDGYGVTAELLEKNGIQTAGESNFAGIEGFL